MSDNKREEIRLGCILYYGWYCERLSGAAKGWWSSDGNRVTVTHVTLHPELDLEVQDAHFLCLVTSPDRERFIPDTFTT